jgi:hypothetical protein
MYMLQEGGSSNLAGRGNWIEIGTGLIEDITVQTANKTITSNILAEWSVI